MRGAFRAVRRHTRIVGPSPATSWRWPRRIFERSRFHAEWLRPQHVLGLSSRSPLAPSPSVVGGLFIGRPRRANGYGDRELDGLRALRPHLVRAVPGAPAAGWRRVGRAGTPWRRSTWSSRACCWSMPGPPSSMPIGPRRRRSGGATGCRATRSVLACDHADDTATLRRLVGEASAAPAGRPGGTLAVGRRSGRRPLSVLVAPLRGERPVPLGPPATAIVLIADPDTNDARHRARSSGSSTA